MNMNDPIFVFGALRSGTTVFRLMLNAHPDVSNPGEANFIFDHMKGTPELDNWAYNFEDLRSDLGFVDFKMTIAQGRDGADLARDFVAQFRGDSSRVFALNVHRNLEKIAALFPGAKLIHIVRDPRDVARSCIGMGWAGNTYFGVDQWIETERNWDAYSWKFNGRNILQVKYEELIRDPRVTLEGVCTFLGVKFTDQMMSYPNSSTYASPDASLVEAWKTKLTVREVALIEMKLGSLLGGGGYELSGYPLDPPGRAEKFLLRWQNRFYKWNVASQRYGLLNVVMERITRKTSPSIHGKLVRRMSVVTRRYLQ